MTEKFYVSLGPKANGFFDQVTGLTIARGQKVEITRAQRNSRRISMALNAGHLILVQPDQEVEKITEQDVNKLNNKLKAQYKKGVTVDKMIKDMSMDQAKALADLHEITIEDGDSIKDIIKAVLSDFEEN